MRNRGNDVEEEPHSMVVIVLLILSASAIAMPPSGPILLPRKLQNEGVAVTKIANFKVEVTHAKHSQRRGASLDGSDRRVDLERLGDCDATLGTEIVYPQAAKRRGNKKGMIGMLLPVTKKEWSECCYRLGNKKCEHQSGGNTCETDATT
jgi:hypothetical protein